MLQASLGLQPAISFIVDGVPSDRLAVSYQA